MKRKSTHQMMWGVVERETGTPFIVTNSRRDARDEVVLCGRDHCRIARLRITEVREK